MTIYLPKEVEVALKEAAWQAHSSKSAFAAQIIAAHFARRKKGKAAQ